MNRKLIFGISIALLCIIGIGVNLWHDITTFKKSLSSDHHMQGKQEQTNRVTATAAETTPVETLEQVDREISEIIEHLEALHAPAEEDEENPPVPDELVDRIAAAWTRLEYISQNPQEWGDLSPQAAELMTELTPTWPINTEGEGEKAIHNLKTLGKLRDPRSAEIFVNYMSRIKGKRIRNSLIAIGPPAVLPLIPILSNQDSTNRGAAARILGAIGSEHQQDLGGAVEYILLPKLEKLATSDPVPRVRKYASEAVSQLR